MVLRRDEINVRMLSSPGRNGEDRETERDLFYTSTTQVWAYGGHLRGNMSLRLAVPNGFHTSVGNFFSELRSAKSTTTYFC